MPDENINVGHFINYIFDYFINKAIFYPKRCGANCEKAMQKMLIIEPLRNCVYPWRLLILKDLILIKFNPKRQLD